MTAAHRKRVAALRRQRVGQQRRLQGLQEEITKLSIKILSEVIKINMPDAKEIVLAATPKRKHWAEAVLALTEVRNGEGNEIDWERTLSADDQALISELQDDLTEHYAIPHDAVGLTIPLKSA